MRCDVEVTDRLTHNTICENICENCILRTKSYKAAFDTNIVLLWIANFNKEQMIKQPIDWLVAVKHQNKLDDERQVV